MFSCLVWEPVEWIYAEDVLYNARFGFDYANWIETQDSSDV